MIGLVAAYALGRSRRRRDCNPLRHDPEYQMYETGVVIGLAFMLFAWPIPMAYWLHRSAHNWWLTVIVPSLTAIVCLALPVLWVIAAALAIAYWWTRLEAADAKRSIGR